MRYSKIRVFYENDTWLRQLCRKYGTPYTVLGRQLGRPGALEHEIAVLISEAAYGEVLYLPPYSPNLNLIERFWKLLKRKVARNRYHATFAEFQAAVQKVLNHIPAYRNELASRMTERFQRFTTP